MTQTDLLHPVASAFPVRAPRRVPAPAAALFAALVRSKGAWALADQAVLSLGNFLTSILLIRHWHGSVGVGIYGQYALILGVIQFLNSIHSSLVTYPLTVRAAGSEIESVRLLTRQSLSLSLCLSPILALAVVAATLVEHRLSLLPWAAGALLLWQAQETLRRALLAKLRHRDALPGDMISYLGQAGLIWAMIRVAGPGTLSPEAAFAAVGFTSGAAAVVQAIQLRVSPQGLDHLRQSMHDCWRLGRWLLLSALLSAATIYVSPWTLQIARGPADVAKFYALSVILNLTNPVMFSVAGLITPAVAAVWARTAERDVHAALIVGFKYAIQGAAVLLPYFVFLEIAPRFALRAFFGPDTPYLALATYLRLFVVGYAMLYLISVYTAILNGMQRGRGTFVSTGVAAGANLLLTVPLAFRFGFGGSVWGGMFPLILQVATARLMLRRASNDCEACALGAEFTATAGCLSSGETAADGHRRRPSSTQSLPVSVILPAYNAARYLADAVDSVLKQSHAEFELLAIDDGSTDETPQILRAFERKDPRVRVISHPNIGMGRSLNEAIELARHSWIARMDADDLMMPRRLERQLAFVEEHPSLAVASSLVQYIDHNGKVLGRNSCEFIDPARVREARDERRLIGFHHPAVLMRREIIRSVGGYRPQFWPADDIDLWNRVVELDPENPAILVQDECLMRYRIHGGSVCVASSRLTAQKAEWVELCMTRRRGGAAEPSWEQFLAERKNLPWPSRLNRERRDWARTLYKSAVFDFSRRSYGRFVPALAGATLLEPEFVLPRVLSLVKR